MRAELVDESDVARGIAESEELLTHDRHALLGAVPLRDLPREEDRDPVAAHQVAHRCAGAGAHQRLRHFPFHACLQGSQPDPIIAQAYWASCCSMS